jgi:CRISPR/Cas system-associated endonuclease Cas1
MDPIKRNELAAIIVSNKIRNQLTVIEKWNWKDNFDWRPDYYEIEKNLHRVC